jgi:hypothetical protein
LIGCGVDSSLTREQLGGVWTLIGHQRSQKLDWSYVICWEWHGD